MVRLGAMGDIIHTLPAAVALKRGYPEIRLSWIVESKWAPLLEGNPFVDELLLLRRNSFANLFSSLGVLRQHSYAFAVDFQGLLKSALIAVAARPGEIFGFDASEVRERASAVFYQHRISSSAAHIVNRNLDLAGAAGGDRGEGPCFPLPSGHPEGELPAGDFVLASPLAGWGAKQWPLPNYRALAELLDQDLGIPLVLNGPPGADFGPIAPAIPHYSALPGLVHATRRAAAVVGVDSGPLHLAAALDKPGAAIFGPTDPARNGPYGSSLRLLRSQSADTTYKRGAAIADSMRSISPREVFETLRSALQARCR